MNIFLDTSSLLKLYHNEKGTKELIELISGNFEKIYLSEIAKIEFSSAIWKKVRSKEFKKEGAKQVIAFFEKDFGNYQWISVQTVIINSAKELIKQYGNNSLRTLDAIQLACAISVKNKVDLFKTADKVLNKILNLENLKTE
ncbi:MAG: type II toxin-antitoxin system VapC family toxin [Bacteroidota bacterium]